MKKSIVLLALCGLCVILASGCGDIVSYKEGELFSKEFLAGDMAYTLETMAPIEEGYYMAEGRLKEMGKDELFLELEDGQVLYFKLSPETIVYAGEEKEIMEGQAIRVVFDAGADKTQMKDVSVIAVTILEENF